MPAQWRDIDRRFRKRVISHEGASRSAIRSANPISPRLESIRRCRPGNPIPFLFSVVRSSSLLLVVLVACTGDEPDAVRLVRDSAGIPTAGNTAASFSTAQRPQPMRIVPAPTSGLTLDHVPIAVANLDRSAEIWRDKLGFSTKPGRLHANTIRNTHLKFADGTGLELITASRPADALAVRYLDLIARGDGAAFVALRPDSIERVAARIDDAGIPFARSDNAYSSLIDFPDRGSLGYLFMISLFAVPADLPEYTTHENGALTLYAAWIRKVSFEAEYALLTALQADTAPQTVALPEGLTAHDVSLDRGHLYLIPADSAGRPVVGVTVVVASADVVARLLPARGVSVLTGTDRRGRYVRVRPEDATGVWLEFLEVAGRDGRARH